MNKYREGKMKTPWKELNSTVKLLRETIAAECRGVLKAGLLWRLQYGAQVGGSVQAAGMN